MSTENRSFGSNQSSNQGSNQNLDASAFIDRRSQGAEPGTESGKERRQFSDSRDSLSPDAAELGKAIDQYKLANRRKYVNYEEMLSIIKSLGYSK